MKFDLGNPRYRKCRVLVIEDEALIALETTGHLLQWGYEVCGVAATACDAIRQAERSRPDLALVDVHLKDGDDGIAAAKLILERWDATVVFLTGQSDCESRRRMSAVGPAACIYKPYDPSRLKSVVEEVSGTR